MLVGSIAFVTTGFWMLMIFDCVRNEPKNSKWLWLLIVLNFPAAIIYLLTRKLSSLTLPIPNLLKHWTMKETLSNAEAGVRDIGKSREYIVLGDVLLEMGKLDRALECYQSVLIDEPNNSHGIWGCATIEIKRGKFHQAMEHLNTLLINEPNYKRGAASLQYGKVLYELAQWSPAKIHLQGDIHHWGHSESFLLLAKISLYYDDDRIAARNYLEAMLHGLKSAPKSNHRNHQHLIREAQKLQKTLA